MGHQFEKMLACERALESRRKATSTI
jgi:hypothetical protein